MKKTALMLTTALIMGLGFAAPVWSQEHVIGGVPVPEDQMEAVQDKCDQLRGADTAATSEAPSADATTTETPAADAAAAGAAMATTTEAPVADAAVAGDAAATAETAPVDDTVSDRIDIATLTIEMCDEGGFVPGVL
jgi:hypothetical protein